MIISKDGNVVKTINNVSVSKENLVYTLEGGVLSAGDYTVSISFADTNNYDVVSLAGTEFNVEQRKVNVSISGEKEYDGNADFTNYADFANPTITAEDGKDIVHQLIVSGSIFATGSVASETAYSYGQGTNLSLNNPNYVIHTVTASFTINKAVVNVTFANPTQTGLVYGQTPSRELS